MPPDAELLPHPNTFKAMKKTAIVIKISDIDDLLRGIDESIFCGIAKVNYPLHTQGKYESPSSRQ